MSERSELANSIDTTDHIGGDPANNEDANRRQIRPRPPEPSILSKSTNDLTDGQSDNNTEDNYDKLDLDRRSTPYKSQEQLEMGVNNYGYMKTMSERGGGSSGGTPNDEWESTLSVFNPYTIETNQLRHPSVGVEMQETAPQDDTNRLSTNSKRSDYSSIPENNYTSPQDMGPQYEDLAAMQNNLRAKFAPNGTSKKANMIYEPASIKKVDKRKKSSASMVSGFEDNSNYCHLVFTFLVAVLAVIALVMVFLLLFGVLSAKSCKECQSGQAGAMSGGIIDDTNTDLQLAYIKGNLTLLQNLLHSNTTKKITNLQNELDVQIKLVSDLRTELTQQKRLTVTLSADSAKARQQYTLHARETNNRLQELGNEFKRMESLSENNTHSLATRFEGRVNGLTKQQIQLTQSLTQTQSKFSLADSDLKSVNSTLQTLFKKVENITYVQGLQGPPGINGTQGPPGKNATLKNCRYVSKPEKANTPNIILPKIVDQNKIKAGTAVALGGSCSCLETLDTMYVNSNSDKVPECTGAFKNDTSKDLDCRLYYLICPV